MTTDTSKIVLVFDLDDTLYKEVDYVYSAFRAVSAYVEAETGFSDAFSVMNKAFKKRLNFFDELVDAMPADKKPDVQKLLEIYRFHTPSLTIDTATKSTLELLAGDDSFILGIITDGRSRSQRNKLEALGIIDLFDNSNIIISEETGFDKHSPDNFNFFKKKYPQAKRFIYVGNDTAKDFFHANKLGWTTICIADDGRNILKQRFGIDKMHDPDILIDEFCDLTSVLYND